MQPQKRFTHPFILCIMLIVTTLLISCDVGVKDPDGADPTDSSQTLAADTIAPIMVDTTLTDSMKRKAPVIRSSGDTSK